MDGMEFSKTSAYQPRWQNKPDGAVPSRRHNPLQTQSSRSSDKTELFGLKPGPQRHLLMVFVTVRIQVVQSSTKVRPRLFAKMEIRDRPL